MKTLKLLFITILFCLIAPFCIGGAKSTTSVENLSVSTPKMSIVIDDFGSYEQSGVEKLLSVNVPLTCAIIPHVDNSESNFKEISEHGHEVILHMPMESHVKLPENWYGPVYIKNSDSPEMAKQKLEECLKEMPSVKGFNFHIGSGVSQNKTLMKAIYEFATEHELYFLDSKTIETTATVDACKETGSIYLGRDIFLEANKNRSYGGVCKRLLEGAKIAKEKGYSIVIGHVGAEGGENTAKAICDTIEEIQKMGIEIVPLSEIYEQLKVCSSNNNNVK